MGQTRRRRGGRPFRADNGCAAIGPISGPRHSGTECQKGQEVTCATARSPRVTSGDGARARPGARHRHRRRQHGDGGGGQGPGGRRFPPDPRPPGRRTARERRWGGPPGASPCDLAHPVSRGASSSPVRTDGPLPITGTARAPCGRCPSWRSARRPPSVDEPIFPTYSRSPSVASRLQSKSPSGRRKPGGN
ncbi:hypothetical protein ACTIVE_3040 [Actinomadura verrucosospora]|uniref:Uncharacterized protein n=1 Tax=Actinomadura verrucosospora TaxID=46165 RepID=A0A7D3ZLM4_ACTVE|nr:hypothetical protein ACTIVE_3040 [Actinomadura verrucosospora]